MQEGGRNFGNEQTHRNLTGMPANCDQTVINSDRITILNEVETFDHPSNRNNEKLVKDESFDILDQIPEKTLNLQSRIKNINYQPSFREGNESSFVGPVMNNDHETQSPFMI